MARTPAAASRPQSGSAAPAAPAMTAAKGVAAVAVSARASSSSAHENMKQTKVAVPMPARISGAKTVMKNRAKP